MAQRFLSAELQLTGSTAGRAKGAGARKRVGSETAAKITTLLKRLGKPATTRGLAGKIAKLANVDRSTVSRHLQRVAK